MPSEAPLELMATLPLFFQNLVLVWRNASSSILVSWIRRMSGWCKEIRSDIASSFALLPSPLQFQERTFITYFWRSGGSLSGRAPDGGCSWYFSTASPRFAGILGVCPCRWLVPFPLSYIFYLWFWLVWGWKFLFPLPLESSAESCSSSD